MSDPYASSNPQLQHQQPSSDSADSCKTMRRRQGQSGCNDPWWSMIIMKLYLPFICMHVVSLWCKKIWMHAQRTEAVHVCCWADRVRKHPSLTNENSLLAAQILASMISHDINEDLVGVCATQESILDDPTAMIGGWTRMQQNPRLQCGFNFCSHEPAGKDAQCQLNHQNVTETWETGVLIIFRQENITPASHGHGRRLKKNWDDNV